MPIWDRGANKQSRIKIDGPVKSLETDDKVKRFKFKARKSLGMMHAYWYAAVTKDAAQRRSWTFCEVVKI